jgi:mono/diheme cytochrome c family protein
MMMTGNKWLIAAALGALVTALSPAPATSSDATDERGRAIAQAKCARCHSIGVQGDSPLALAPPFRVLPKRYPVENLAEALAEGIYVGHPMMPEFKFDPPEIDALLSFMASLSKRAEEQRTRPAPRR